MMAWMLILLTAALAVHAEESVEVRTQNLLIEKLTKVSLGMAPGEGAKAAITLRLADLHAERGRQLAMKELNNDCVTNCTAGNADREQAILYYNEVLAGLKGDHRAKVLTQIGHLQELTGHEAKAIAIYEGLLKESTPQIVAEAQLSLAEIYFKKRNWKQALAYYQKVKASHPTQKGLAAYRVGWCYFNEEQVNPAISELKAVLTSPEMLSRGQSGTILVDKQFQEEVSRDLATFMSRRGFNESELDELYKLSPENARLAHLTYLASEYERLGQVPAAISSWRYVIQKQADPKARLEGHVHLAQLQAIHKNQPEAIKDFDTSLAIWSQLGQCQDDTCTQLRTRLRQFVLDWNQREKTEPSREILQAYQKYLKVFPADTDMRLWQAQVASQLKEHEIAVSENLLVAKELSLLNQKSPLDKTKREWLEASLLAAIENAEMTKKAELENQSTQAYLDLSLDRKKELDVLYQRAHAQYEAGQYSVAADQMKAIALNSKAPTDVRVKAADLTLDSLVILKDDLRLEQWSKELSQALPQQGPSFMSVARKSILTQSAALAPNDQEKAWVTLNRFEVAGSSQEDKTAYLKNKLILAEKLKKLPEARDAAEQLLRQPGLSVEDTQFALSRKAWFAELQFDFPAALAATQKMSPLKGVDNSGRELKMAVLAELSQKDATPHYKKFVQESKDKEKNAAVIAQIVKSSPNALKDFEQFKNVLAQKPEFYTEVLYEVSAKAGKPELLTKITSQPQMMATPYGKAALRAQLVSGYEANKAKFAQTSIDSSNQRKLAATLKARVNLIENTEKLAARAVDQQEWASQILLLNLLAGEHKRFYDEVLSLPVPQGLSGEEEQQYLMLLSQQAAPHQTKANDIKVKLEQIYANKKAFSDFSEAVSAEPEPMRGLFTKEMLAVRAVVPAELQALLTERLPASGGVQPTVADIEKARQTVRDRPFDPAQLENLMTLEKQMGQTSMVAYLQGRLETLKAENANAPAQPAVKQ